MAILLITVFVRYDEIIGSFQAQKHLQTLRTAPLIRSLSVSTDLFFIMLMPNKVRSCLRHRYSGTLKTIVGEILLN